MTAITLTAIKIEKVTSTIVTPIASASILVAMACKITKDTPKGLTVLVTALSSAFKISTMIFIERNKNIPADKNFINPDIKPKNIEPTKYPISGIIP